MSIRKKERMNKISRLIEGGFDGSIGSEKHHNEIQNYLREKNFGPDSNEESSGFYNLEEDVPLGIEGVGPGASGYMKDSLLPYSTEGMLDEDVHVYILDQSFFGENEEEYKKSIEVARFIFGPMNLGGVKVQVGTSDIETGGLRAKNKNLMNKSELILNISAVLESHGNFGEGIDHTNYYDSDGGEASKITSPSDGSKPGGKNSRGGRKKTSVDSEGDFESNNRESFGDKYASSYRKIARYSKLKEIYSASIVYKESPLDRFLEDEDIPIGDDPNLEDAVPSYSSQEMAPIEEDLIFVDKKNKEEEGELKIEEEDFYKDSRYGIVNLFSKESLLNITNLNIERIDKKIGKINSDEKLRDFAKAKLIAKENDKKEEFVDLLSICKLCIAQKRDIVKFEELKSSKLSGNKRKKKSFKQNLSSLEYKIRQRFDSIKIKFDEFAANHTGLLESLQNNQIDKEKEEEEYFENNDYNDLSYHSEMDQRSLSGLNSVEELTSKQMQPLQHLLMSLRKSELPFILFVYDPNAGENISFSGIKHDSIHILKDPREQDKKLIADITIPTGRDAVGPQILNERTSSGYIARYDPKNYYDVGILFNGVYSAINTLGKKIMELLLEAEKSSIQLIDYKEKISGLDLRVFLQDKKNITEEQMDARKFKHDILDFASKYFVVNYKNYTDKDVFINNVWNSDRFQDIVQHIVFNTLTKADLRDNKKIIDFDLGSDEEIIEDLNNWFKLELDSNYHDYEKPIYDKKTKSWDTIETSIIDDLRKIFSETANNIAEKTLEYIEGIKTDTRERKTKEFNRQTDELLREEDKFFKIKNESSALEDASTPEAKEALENFMANIKQRPRLDGLIRRRLRFLSKDKDVVFCFIRLSAPEGTKLEEPSEGN